MGDPLGVDLPSDPPRAKCRGLAGSAGLSHRLIQRTHRPRRYPGSACMGFGAGSGGGGIGSRIQDPESGIRDTGSTNGSRESFLASRLKRNKFSVLATALVRGPGARLWCAVSGARPWCTKQVRALVPGKQILLYNTSRW